MPVMSQVTPTLWLTDALVRTTFLRKFFTSVGDVGVGGWVTRCAQKDDDVVRMSAGRTLVKPTPRVGGTSRGM
jgi:hypothetical protein